MADLRYALRMLLKNPAFSALVIGILALGIGVNTAVFSVVNSVLLRPLPYKDAGRLVAIWETNPKLNVEREGPSGPNFLDWREQNHSFEEMTLLEPGTGTLTGSGEPEQFPGLRVSTNFFTMLGAQPLLGRLFRPEDGEGAARHNVAVLSYGFWQDHFGGRTNVVGMPLTINHQLYECVGVLPKNMWSPIRADAYVPWPVEELRGRPRFGRDFGVLARLKPGVSIKQAQQDMDAIAARIGQQFPVVAGWKTTVVPLQEALVEYIRPALMMLLASVLFVLLLACANVANLLLARMTSREREVGIRSAMGAGRWRLIRQFLAENLLVSLLAGVAGLLVAIWGVDLLQHALPQTIPLPNASTEVVLPEIRVDSSVLAFAMALAFACSFLFGIVPAFQASRSDLNRVLKEGGRGSTGTSRQNRVRRLLVISETALAFMLLMGAALTMRSFIELQKVNPGFHAENVLTFRLRLPTDSLYQKPEQQAEFFRQTLDRLQEIPGVQSAGVTEIVPLGQENTRRTFKRADVADVPGSELPTDFRRASPRLFESLGIALTRGRSFTEHDTVDRPLVVVVDETFVKRYYPNENPIGKRILMIGSREIVGVVAPVRHYGLDQPPRPTLYASYLQLPSDRMVLIVKTQADSARMITAVKQAVWSVDKDQPVFMIRSMNDYIALANSAPRIAFMLLSVFAVVALALAAFGIYGVISYTVSQRTHEFGLRLALGAQPSEIKSLVLRNGLKWSLIGLGAGLLGAMLVAPALRSVLYGVSTLDPLAVAVTSVVLLVVAGLANWLPARRATRVDPMIALRYE